MGMQNANNGRMQHISIDRRRDAYLVLTHTLACMMSLQSRIMDKDKKAASNDEPLF